MRKGKRFTPRMIRRWRERGRGQDRLKNYQAWHQITRGDPASRGRSHLLPWLRLARQLNLLSDLEQVAFFFAAMLRHLRDAREQFPLSFECGEHELCLYVAGQVRGSYDGTKNIAAALGVRHPTVREGADEEHWIFTTDLLLTICESLKWSLLAVSVKPDEALDERSKDLLRVEQEYWSVRGVSWLLITPNEYDKRVALCLRRSAPWVITSAQASESEMQRCAEIVLTCEYRTLTTALQAIQSGLSIDRQHAQRVFWQAVWNGTLPIDLRRGWRPSEPLAILKYQDFLELNPIAMRRSACLT